MERCEIVVLELGNLSLTHSLASSRRRPYSSHQDSLPLFMCMCVLGLFSRGLCHLARLAGFVLQILGFATKIYKHYKLTKKYGQNLCLDVACVFQYYNVTLGFKQKERRRKKHSFSGKVRMGKEEKDTDILKVILT